MKRTGSEVHVKADITPEHKIRDKPYEVNCIVDETKEQIVGAYCSDCSASTGKSPLSLISLHIFKLYQSRLQLSARKEA